MMSICHLSKSIKCTPRANPNVNYGLSVIAMCHYGLINGNKCTILVSDVDNERGYACVEARGMWAISVPSAPFCYKHKSAL